MLLLLAESIWFGASNLPSPMDLLQIEAAY